MHYFCNKIKNSSSDGGLCETPLPQSTCGCCTRSVILSPYVEKRSYASGLECQPPFQMVPPPMTPRHALKFSILNFRFESSMIGNLRSSVIGNLKSPNYWVLESSSASPQWLATIIERDLYVSRMMGRRMTLCNSQKEINVNDIFYSVHIYSKSLLSVTRGYSRSSIQHGNRCVELRLYSRGTLYRISSLPGREWGRTIGVYYGGTLILYDQLITYFISVKLDT